MSLKYSQEYIFPSELIQMIMKLYWSLWSAPVLVLFTLDKSYYCKDLDDIWYPSPRGRLPKGESILCKLTEMYPGLRFVNISYGTNLKIEHPELYPLRMKRYTNWLSKIILIPGPLWDHAMLYPESSIEIIDGIQVFNTILKDNSFYAIHGMGHDIEDRIPPKILMYHPKYDSTKVDDYVQWFTDSLNDPEFIAVQNKLM
jgi:hypothetical protein